MSEQNEKPPQECEPKNGDQEKPEQKRRRKVNPHTSVPARESRTQEPPDLVTR